MAGVAATALLAIVGTHHAVTAQSGDRTISLYNIHTKETVTVTYKKGGKFVDAGLERVNHALRDHRRNEATRMDPELVDLLWDMHNELGSKEPIHIISGYRSRATNEQLRRTVGGQASESRHILGKAADVHFPDVPVKNLRYSALVREKGGVGYYPTSAIPFVHVDTDRVRSWPRLPRYELALLFPSGTTKHAAADGGPISQDDVRVAESKHRDLATQIASFHDARNGNTRMAAAAKAQQVAALAPKPEAPAPKLLEPPTRAATNNKPAVTSNDREGLSSLFLKASSEPMLKSGPVLVPRPQRALPSLTGNQAVAGLTPPTAAAPATKLAAVDPAALPSGGRNLTDGSRFGFATNWLQSPAFDDEHPEELSYRPFPIAPFLTASANEPLMTELIMPDVARTVDMIDQSASLPPMRFRPAERAAQKLWSLQFTGEAVDLSKLQDATAAIPAGLQNRQVRTSKK